MDGFTTHKANYGGAGEGETHAASSCVNGIGHFFGAMRIDGFREPVQFKAAIDEWQQTFRGCEPVDKDHTVLVPGDPEWSAQEFREKHGIPVKLAVIADLVHPATMNKTLSAHEFLSDRDFEGCLGGIAV